GGRGSLFVFETMVCFSYLLPSFLVSSYFFFLVPFLEVCFFLVLSVPLTEVCVVVSPFFGASWVRPRTPPLGWIRALAPSTSSALFNRVRRLDPFFVDAPCNGSCSLIDMESPVLRFMNFDPINLLEPKT